MKRRTRRSTQQTFEVLEQRTLLTGDVTAVVTDAGDVVVTGDDENNAIWMKQDASHNHGNGHEVWLWGDEGTTINGQQYTMDEPLGLPGLTRDVQIDLGNGNDDLYSFGADIPGSLVVQMGDGQNRVHVDQGSIGDQLILRGGRAKDQLYVEGTTVGNRLFGQGFRGHDYVHISDTSARKIDVRAGHGRDEVWVTDVDVKRATRVNGGAGEDYYGSEEEYEYGEAPANITGFEDYGRNTEPNNVMDEKLNDAINLLDRGRTGPEGHEQAIDQIMESLFVSNLVPLPTADPDGNPNQADLQDFINFNRDMEDAINALTKHVNSSKVGTDETKTDAAEARNFLQLTQEALQVIAGQTAFCHPGEDDGDIGLTTTGEDADAGNFNGPGCQFVGADDEGGRTIDEILADFSRQVRSPFPIIFSGQLEPDEVVIDLPALSDGQCGGAVKEFQGVKAVVTARKLPIWVEPWLARARVVGFRTVWVFEFVPAEFIKTISVCNNDGELETNVSSVTVHDRALMHFWRYFEQP